MLAVIDGYADMVLVPLREFAHAVALPASELEDRRTLTAGIWAIIGPQF